MCGRYAASTHPDKLIEIFEVDEVPDSDPVTRPDGLAEWARPRWNIAPTDSVPAIIERSREHGATRLLTGLRWGLVPSWAKTPNEGARLINARFETVDTKPAFRKAFASRRCLLPADGFYEWRAETTDTGKSYKQPYFITADDDLFVMAGIYEFWRDRSAAASGADWLVSCAIITTQAVDELGRIHDRMPLQVAPQNWDAWLDPGLTAAGRAKALAHIPAPGELTWHPVSTKVNKVANDGPDLIVEIDSDEAGE